LKVKIIYYDEYIAVIDKPSGLVVNRAASVKGKSLQDILEEEGIIDAGKWSDEAFRSRSGLAHRLDKDTSGVLVVGRTPEALKFLLAEFKERRVKKKYITLVHGLVPEEGVIEAPIRRHPLNKRKFSVFIGGRESMTAYKLIESFWYKGQAFSLVEVRPRTGRTHQIRVHFRYIDHPVVGDSVYAGRKNIQIDQEITKRIFLHAAQISFRHPSSKKYVQFESKLPVDLRNVLEKLENK